MAFVYWTLEYSFQMMALVLVFLCTVFQDSDRNWYVLRSFTDSREQAIERITNVVWMWDIVFSFLLLTAICCEELYQVHEQVRTDIVVFSNWNVWLSNANICTICSGNLSVVFISNRTSGTSTITNIVYKKAFNDLPETTGMLASAFNKKIA